MGKKYSTSKLIYKFPETLPYLPLVGVAHDDLPALCVVSGHAHLLDVLGRLDADGLVDLVFDGQAVAVPAEPALHVEPALMGIARHYILRERGKLYKDLCTTGLIRWLVFTMDHVEVSEGVILK